MIHGRGCPVCVTPLETPDRALAERGPARPDPTRGDLHQLRRHAARPGHAPDPLSLRARGADVRVVYAAPP
ncbi:hypothetical protein [Streptomyces akebiae]|uniref:hypothetical protein n=1 Tax=Streptomyces akebiae TaxID=2865673 RepID=UPI0037DA1E0E